MGEFPRALKLTTIWLLIGAAVFLAVQAWQSHEQRTRVSVAPGGAIEIRRAADGHYHWSGRIEGRAVDFLVDTGATTTAVPQRLAQSLGLAPLGRVESATANGPTVGTLHRVSVSLDGGIVIEGLRVVALPSLGAPLLGMNVMSRLRWRQQGDRLIIEAAPVH